MWNIDSMDWADPVPESIVQRVLDQVNKEQRGIILFHDIHDRAVKALPQILDRLIADGYQFAGWNGRDFTVARARKGDASAATVTTGYEKSWAIVVGIDNYAKWPKLEYASHDAQAVADTLTGQFGFPSSQVIVLKNEQATRNNIPAAFHDRRPMTALAGTTACSCSSPATARPASSPQGATSATSSRLIRTRRNSLPMPSR